MFLYLIKYKLKLIEKEEMKECFFSIFKKFKNIDKLVEEFWDTHEKNIKDFFKNKKTHKKDIISSASPYFLLEPIAKKYEVYDLFASPVNKKNGKYKGVGAHLFAIACKLSWDVGNEGYVQFTAKTDLIGHYEKMLNAKPVDWHTLYIDSYGAVALINKYFKEGDVCDNSRKETKKLH